MTPDTFQLSFLSHKHSFGSFNPWYRSTDLSEADGNSRELGKVSKSQYADLAVLSDDYFTIPVDEVKTIHSLLTIVNGKVVYAEGTCQNLSPQMPGAIPSMECCKIFCRISDSMIMKKNSPA